MGYADAIFHQSDTGRLSMATPLQITKAIVNLSPIDELLARDSSVLVAARSLCSTAKPPVDCACLFLACQGAKRSFLAAMLLLIAPNSLAFGVLEQLTELESACEKIYAEREIVDAFSTLRRRLSHHQGWAALATAASIESTDGHGVLAAIGVNFGLAWIEEKKLALAYMNSLRRCIGNCDIGIEDLIGLSEEDIKNNQNLDWLSRFDKFRIEFQQVFDTHPERQPPRKSFDNKAISELKARAAFPSFRRRAAVLDKTCLSKRQVAEACRFPGSNGFPCAAERRIAMWLIGFSGLNTETVHRIPILGGNGILTTDNWSAYYDVAKGCLLRDYGSLTADAATSEGLNMEPSSYILVLPAPMDIAGDIRCLVDQNSVIKTFGELIPTLVQLRPEQLLYPTSDEVSPSWARWARTVGPYCRQLGDDNFLAAVLVGDLGQTARSKMFYARVDSHELWAAVAKIYARFGWGLPVAEPNVQMAFGCQVVPSGNQIQYLDTENLDRVSTVRPAKRSTLEIELKFHNAYTVAIGLRMMVYLSLRGSKVLPISAAVDEKCALTIDLHEKGSAGRSGGISAIMTRRMREEIRLYRQHCLALHRRFKRLHLRGTVMNWIASVLARDDVPLFALIPSENRLEFVGSNSILKGCSASSYLTDDFGRKFNENALRTAGCRTGDIDRVLRHEVLGQETTSAVSDANERTWVNRVEPVLNRIHCELFLSPLHGLRKE